MPSRLPVPYYFTDTRQKNFCKQTLAPNGRPNATTANSLRFVATRRLVKSKTVSAHVKCKIIFLLLKIFEDKRPYFWILPEFALCAGDDFGKDDGFIVGNDQFSGE